MVTVFLLFNYKCWVFEQDRVAAKRDKYRVSEQGRAAAKRDKHWVFGKG